MNVRRSTAVLVLLLIIAFLGAVLADLHGGIPYVEAVLLDHRYWLARACGKAYLPRHPVTVVMPRASELSNRTREAIASEAAELSTMFNPLIIDEVFVDRREPQDDAAASEVWLSALTAAAASRRTIAFAVAGPLTSDSHGPCPSIHPCASDPHVVPRLIPTTHGDPHITLAPAQFTPASQRNTHDGVIRKLAVCFRLRGGTTAASSLDINRTHEPLWRVAAGGVLDPAEIHDGDVYVPVPPLRSDLGVQKTEYLLPSDLAGRSGPAILAEASGCGPDLHRLPGTPPIDGPYIQAWLASAAREHRFPRPVALWCDVLLALLVTAVLMIIAVRARMVVAVLGVPSALLVHVAIGDLFLAFANRMFTGSVMYAFVWVAAAMLLARRALLEYRDRLETRLKLGRYFPKDVYSEILRNPERLQPRGQRARLTLLYSDIRGFTSATETLAPDQLFAHLNDYFRLVTSVILDHHGNLQHFVGDQVLAFWGAPLPIQPREAARLAFDAAIEIQSRLSQFRNAKGSDIGPMFRSGAGIVTGEAIAGELGSEFRLDYGFVGDVVPLGARLESMTKDFHLPILLDAATAELIGNLVPLRFLGRVIAAGRTTATAVYAPLGDLPPADARTYERALRLAESDERDAAVQLLVNADLPDRDFPSLLLARECPAGEGPLPPFRFSK